MLGSWTARSQVTLGFALHPPLPDTGKRITWGHPYPDFETNLFDQTVDLTVSLWLYKRYFFEATFADESKVNSIAVGYVAAGDELVQEFVAGNVPLAISRYPYQYSGNTTGLGGRTPNPGTVLRLKTDRTFHEFLLQFENSTEQRLRISGGKVVDEVRIRPEDYLRGRSFVLPDRNVTNVEVLLQDENGSLLGQAPDESQYRRYRRLEDAAGDYVVDRQSGTIRLSETVPANRVVAVYYEASARAVGHSNNGIGGLVALDDDGGTGSLAPTTGNKDFRFDKDNLFELTDGNADYDGNDFRLNLSDNRDALILRAPGLWSPFEAANLYRLPDGAGEDARFQLVRRHTNTLVDSPIQLRRISGTTLLQAVRADAAVTEIGYRYPWATEPPADIHARMYGPRSSPTSDLSSSDVLVEYGYSADTIRLTGDIVPGSVAVRSGGQSVSGATVDYTSGTVELPEEITGAGTVDISYRVYGAGGDATDLVFISGNRWTPTPNLDLSLAAGLRWTLTDSGYSTELNQHPGQITVSSGVAWQGENLRLEAAGAAQISQSDTTGYMRLFGAASQDVLLTPSAETLFPPRPPSHPTTTLSAADFVYPRYRDYWSTDALGNVSLGTYPSLPDPDTDRTNARIGPYLSRSTDSGYTGTIAVVEWDQIPGGSWTGARINRDGDDLDLRDAQSIEITYRYIDDGGGGSAPKLLFEIGSLGEDLDGDSSLDRGKSAVDPLLAFDGAGGLRRAGQDAPALTRPHSEDSNRNGVLDPEIPSAVFSHPLTLTTATGWQTEEIPLTGVSGATARSHLSAVRAARIIVEADGSNVTGGRLLIGEIRIRRGKSVTLADAGADNSGSVGVVPDPLPDPNTGGASLRSRFDTVKSRFAPDSDEQRVISLSWDDGAETVAAEFTLPDFSTRAYRTLTGFFFLDAPPFVTGSGGTDQTVTLRLAPYRNAPDDESVTVVLPADRLTGGWHEVSIDLKDETVRLDGTRLASAAVQTGNRADDELLRLASLTVNGIGTTGQIGTGTLYFDELHATDPQTGFALAGRVQADWNRTVEAGLLGGTEFYVSQTVAAQGEDFQAAGSAASDDTVGAGSGSVPGTGTVATTTKAGLRSGPVHLEGEVLARGSANDSVNESDSDSDAAFGHYVQLPLAPAQAVLLRERFFRDYRYGSTRFSRNTGITLSGTSWGRYQLESSHTVGERESQQTWRLDLTPPSLGPVKIGLSADAAVYAPDLTVGPGTYSDSWLQSNTYFLPVPESRSAQERRQTSRFRLEVSPFETTTTAGWINRSSLSGDQEHQLSTDARLPLSFTPAGRRPWRLTPSYRRSYTFSEELSSSSFSEDASAWAARISDEPVIFTAPPIVELFHPDGPIRFAPFRPEELTRKYDAEGKIHFSRAFSSRISDLWTPSNVEALLRRSMRWEGNTLDDSRNWQLNMTAVAINLFGREGAQSRYRFYRSDEFRNAVNLSLKEFPGSPQKPEWSIGLEQTSSFFGNPNVGDQSFGGPNLPGTSPPAGPPKSPGAGFPGTSPGDTDNRLDLTSSVKLTESTSRTLDFGSTIAYIWNRPGYPPLKVFQRMDEKPFYRHHESLTVSITATDGEFTGSEVTLGHSTRLVITQQGSIAAFGDLGWIADPGEYDNGALHLIGLRIGIEGRLTY